jgi:hypothetical protein
VLHCVSVTQHSIFGDPALWRPTSPLRVKGSLMAARPRYLREHWGQTAVDQVVASVGDDARPLLTNEVLPFRWYPMALMAEIDRAIIEGPMQGDVSRMKAFGSEIARYDLPTLYKMLFRFGTPSFVVKRLNIAYATYIDGGRVQIEVPAREQARVTLHDAVLPNYLCTHGISGWITAALELSGANHVQVEESQCLHEGAPRCCWDSHWS